jgi:lambda repressor-like predicted transcriptional regulator
VIDPVNGGQGSASPAASQGTGAVWQQVLQSAGSVLGMSTGDLTTALRSGQSLAQIAQQKGVSQSELTGAVTQALNTAAQNGASLPADASTMAQRIVNHTGGASGHRHHHGGSSTDGSSSGSETSGDSMLSSISSALGMQPTDLLQTLVGGTSLQSLAQHNGVSEQSLEDIVGGGQGHALAVDTTA